MKRFLLHCRSIGLLVLGMSVTLAGQLAAKDLKEQAPSAQFTLSKGERIEVPEKGFSIVAPEGWEVHRSYPGLSLLLQVPLVRGLAYQRSIKVMAFKGSVYIDDVTGREFEQTIVKKYSHISQSLSNFRMRNYVLTKMEDGSEGILYYSEFQLEDKQMMQAHILVASERFHYLLTYTDVAEHFQGDAAGKYLKKAWESMTSIRLAGDAPVRFRKLILFGLGMIAFLVFISLLYLFRHARATQSYSSQAHADRDDEDDDGGEVATSAEELIASGAPSSFSGLRSQADSRFDSHDEDESSRPSKLRKAKGKRARVDDDADADHDDDDSASRHWAQAKSKAAPPDAKPKSKPVQEDSDEQASRFAWAKRKAKRPRGDDADDDSSTFRESKRPHDDDAGGRSASHKSKGKRSRGDEDEELSGEATGGGWKLTPSSEPTSSHDRDSHKSASKYNGDDDDDDEAIWKSTDDSSFKEK